MTGAAPLRSGPTQMALHLAGATLGTMAALVTALLVGKATSALDLPARTAVELRLYLAALLPALAAAGTVSVLSAACHRPRRDLRSGFGGLFLANGLLALALAALVALPPMFEGGSKIQFRIVLGMYAMVSLMTSVRTAAALDKPAGAGHREKGVESA